MCVSKSVSPNDALPSYEYLLGLKDSIPEELYAYHFRRLLQFNTKNVTKEMRLKMFEGVKPENIMFQDELDAIAGFDDYITAYRGTTPDEDVPGISWSLDRSVAEGTFYKGRLFEASIPKSNILLYSMHQEDEEEIIANVTSGFRIIDEG